MAVDPVFARRLSKLAALKDKVDAPDDFFSQMVHRTVMLETKIERMSDKEASDLVIQMSADPNRKQDVGQALVCLMLTEKENVNKYITLLSQMGDMWFQALYTLNMVSIEMFGKLNETCKDMILVFFKEAIKFNVPKLDSTFLNFVRTLNGTGEWSSRLRLAREFATLFLECKDYMLNSMKAGALFYGLMVNTYGHLAADVAANSQLDKEKNLFCDVIVLIIRKRPQESFQLGRDLFYTLMRIARIPQIAQLFQDLVKKPALFNIKGFEEVCFKTPSPNLSTIRLSIDVTRKVEFLISGMKISSQSKHWEWFTNSHLKGPDSQSMRAELIRFVLFYFPPNQPATIYESRMQFIHFLLNTAAFGSESQWCKTALWFDWLFFDPVTQFYTLEPALAVVRYCIGVQATKASSLLEYLIKQAKEIYPPLQGRITIAMNTAMKTMADFLTTNNQPPVSNILENPRVDAPVREMLRGVFKDFVSATPIVENNTTNAKENWSEKPAKVKKEEIENNNRRSKSPTPPQSRLRNKTLSKEDQEKELETNLTLLRDDLKDIVEMVKSAFTNEESDDSDRGESVGKLLQKLLENDQDQVEEEQHWTLGQCLLSLIGRPEAVKSLVPEVNTNSDNQDPYQEIFSHPIFIVFRNLCYTPINETTSRTPLIRIIGAMREKDNFITILLIYFIKCGFGTNSNNNDHIKCYEEVATAMDKEVSELLSEDIETVALEDEKLFTLLLPFIFEKFYQDIGSSPEVLHVVCCHMDSSQLADIVGSMIREGNSLFRKDNVCNIVTASMDWSTTAQLLLWQLIHSEGVPMDWLLPIVPKIRSDQHAETAVNLLLTLRRLDREPGMSLLRTILSRPPSKDDFFTINCFRILIDEADMCTKVADLIAQLIKKLINNNELHMTNNVNSQKNQGKKAAPKLSLEQLLSHMSFFIDHCLAKEQKVAETLLSKWSVQEAFKTITSNDKTTMMRPKFQRLFTVLELLADDSPQSSRTLRGGRGNNHTPQSKASRKHKEDEDDGPVPNKQRKRVIQVTLDSDSD